jgi:hypothetical protein
MRTRLERKVYTTEDSVRYTFFAALLAKSGIEPHDIVLEYPHPTIPGAEIDAFLTSFHGRPTAIEFKYDREIPSGAAVPRPQNAGELFKDIARLSRFIATPEPRRMLVYCTDSIMATYLGNPANGHAAFFNLQKGKRVKIDSSYLAPKPATFKKALRFELLAELECTWSEVLPHECQLRVYDVLRVDGAV